MPSKKNPGTIRTGAGKRSYEKENWRLNGAPVGGIDENDPTYPEAEHDHGVGEDGEAGLEAHVNTTYNAHPATAISIDGYPAEVFSQNNVETAIDELTGLVPPKPPKLGFFRDYMSILGIPDWGVLKLYDAPLTWNDPTMFTHTSNVPAKIYPYYWHPPHPAQVYKPFDPDDTAIDFDYSWATGEGWAMGGDDPISDPMFNIDDFRPLAGYPGGGKGRTFAGGWTRVDGGPGPYPVIKTMRNLLLGNSPTPEFPVVVSGMVYPADRGVLALLHWPALDTGMTEQQRIDAFLAQDLEDRCLAAIVMGQGLWDAGNCYEDNPCDGMPGGIFLLGTDANGNYDPYVWPGQATGQGSLFEIYSGVRQDQTPTGTGTAPDNIADFQPFASSSVYFNFDGAAADGPFAITNIQVDTPVAGQMTITCGGGHSYYQWGVATITGNTSTPSIDGNSVVLSVAGNDFVIAKAAPTVTVIDGDAYFEAGVHSDDYPDANEVPFPGQVRLGTVSGAGETPISGGIPVLGAWKEARGSGHLDNFFRYRLPYLDDYDYDNLTSGLALKWTPNAEKPRYFTKPQLAEGMDLATQDVTLEQAGNYPDFTKDYWPWQVARYRHNFDAVCGSCGIAPTDLGSLYLIHFKTERAFEEMVRDGTMPTEDDVYSAALYDYSNPEDLLNLANDVSVTAARDSYHTMRGVIFGDTTDGVAAPTFSSPPEFDYDDAANPSGFFLQWVSGVAYFSPVDNAGVPSFRFSTVNAVADGLWENTYRIRDNEADWINMPNPAFLGMAPFAWTNNLTGFLAPSTGQARRQRIEFPMQTLGAYTLADGPDPADPATIALTDMLTAGDDIESAFSIEAQPRVFYRRPLGHGSVTATTLPVGGEIVAPADGNKVLYHSSNPSATPEFGNWQVNPGVNFNPIASVVTARKDAGEWFLDEVYRYDSTFSTLSSSERQVLVGPGMAGTPSPIGIYVRPWVAAPYQGISWLYSDLHLSSLPVNELQVAGLPDRNPPFAEGVTVPFPGRGMVIYPQFDFSAGYRPDGGDFPGVQPDYSALASTGGERHYIRCLDAARSRWSGKTIKAGGQPFFTLDIYGLLMEDFNYSAPGPGGAQVAILVKVPGLTTWMDLGRNDGSGPSKQDPALDGAGCRVISESSDGYDPVTGVAFSRIKVNVGPAANLFKSGVDDEVPILVKVLLKDPTVDSDVFKWTFKFQRSGTTFSGPQDPNLQTGQVRAVVGIHVVDPVSEEAPSAAASSTPWSGGSTPVVP